MSTTGPDGPLGPIDPAAGAHGPAGGPSAAPGAPPAAPGGPGAPIGFLDLDEPYVDPAELAGGDGPAAPATTPLDDLVAALTTNAEDGDGTITVAVPTRRAIRLRQRDTISGRQIEEWRKQAKVRGQVDPIKFAALILAHTSVGLERNEEPVLDPGTGERVTLRSEWLWRLYDAPGAVEGVRRLFGKDGYVNAAAAEVMAAAGWGSELSEDPT